MKKQLLFASIITIFSVVSSMAQTQTYNLFIGKTDSLYYEWAKIRVNKASAWPNAGGTCTTTPCDQNGWPMDDNDAPANGFIWTGIPGFKNGVGTDSIGAVSSNQPYEGDTHYEFNYKQTDYWAAGGWVINKFKNATYAYPEDLSGYTHLKLYWKGYSPVGDAFNFSLIGPDTGPAVVICDNLGSATYKQKIVPMSSFLGTWVDYQNVSHTLSDLTAVVRMNFGVQVAGMVTSGSFFMDAIQFVKIPDLILVEGNGFAVTPTDTMPYNFGDVGIGNTIPTTFKISNVNNSTTLTLAGTPVISGTDAADFTVTTNPATSIAAGTSANFTITFNPSSLGTKTATLTIANSFSTGGSYIINLTGEGVNNVTGLSYSKGTDSYTAYPSPFYDEAVIKVNSTVNTPMNIKVIDTKGTVVSTSDSHSTNENIAIGKGLEKGIYFVQATYQNRMQVIKIVKI
jgi:hypothetical protein